MQRRIGKQSGGLFSRRWVQRPDHPLSREGEVDLDAQALAVEVVQYVQKPKLAAIGQTIRHKIHRPHEVRRARNREHVRLVPFDATPGFDPQVQFQLAVDPADALVVPDVSANIAQI